MGKRRQINGYHCRGNWKNPERIKEEIEVGLEFLSKGGEVNLDPSQELLYAGTRRVYRKKVSE